MQSVQAIKPIAWDLQSIFRYVKYLCRIVNVNRTNPPKKVISQSPAQKCIAQFIIIIIITDVGRDVIFSN